MPWIAGGMAASGLVSGLLGASAQRSASQEAADAQKAALAGYFYQLDQVGIPPDLSAPIFLNQYKQAGLLTPQLEQQIKDAVSQFHDIKQNEQAVQFQQQALQRLSQSGRAGLSPEERAQQRQLQSEASRQAEAQQQQIIQNLAARGQAGGGAEIAARLGASQAAAQQASSIADQISGMASQRALQSMLSGSSLAGQLESQQFGEQAQKAQAADVMDRFKIQNQLGIQERNIAAQRAAQAANLAQAQNISNLNIGQANQELYRQAEAKRQNYLDRLARAQAYGGLLGAYGQVGSQQAQQRGQIGANMWQGLGQAVTGGLGYLGQQQNFDRLLNAKQNAPIEPAATNVAASQLNSTSSIPLAQPQSDYWNWRMSGGRGQ